ncbi:MAG: polymerase, sigma 28 subunit, FliA/WhiG subfamily [Lachnospiraceae bacterium]|nr:polymerase, sigma 28 subunit, FliA/WhiG subfamily [Lachnospiraceae bacterium]
MRELDYLVLEASNNQAILNELIEQNEFFILKCASSVTHHYITKSDDEWSIALTAFVQAIHNYDLNKGSFLSFAELVIRRRLVDYIRSQVKHSMEVSVDPIIFDTDTEDNDTDISIRLAVADQVARENNHSMRLEISSINDVFTEYGFTFFDLTSCSPHAKKTRTACGKAVGFMLNYPLLLSEMRSTKQLPLKIIEKNAKVPRKILERHRKYIIAAIEILSGEYPKLAEYLRYIREEM